MDYRSREPLPRSRHAAVGIGSKLYVWAGDHSHLTIQSRKLEIFDVPSMTWEWPQALYGSDMPDGLRGMAVTTDDVTSYTFGGATGSSNPYTYHNMLFQVTPSQHLCQTLEPLNPVSTSQKKIAGSGIVHFKDKLVLYGGFTGLGCTDELHAFDLRNGECELWN